MVVLRYQFERVPVNENIVRAKPQSTISISKILRDQTSHIKREEGGLIHQEERKDFMNMKTNSLHSTDKRLHLNNLNN